MYHSTARAVLQLSARAVVIFGSACVDGPGSGRAPAVFFQTDSTQPHFGSAIVAPISARSLTALANDRSAADDWQRVLTVRAGDTTGLPMLGKYVISSDTLRFEPSFPPIRGTTYTARFDGHALN